MIWKVLSDKKLLDAQFFFSYILLDQTDLKLLLSDAEFPHTYIDKLLQLFNILSL